MPDAADKPRDNAWRAQFAGPIPDYQEQVELAQAIEAGVLADGVLAGEIGRPSSATEEELGELARLGRLAMETFVRGNLRLVVHWAYRSAPLLDVEDKFQHGVFGLTRAVERWDWRRGYTFATYASWHIRQAIARGIANDCRVIRIPVHLQEDLRAELAGTTDEVADDRPSIQAARAVMAGVSSLDELETDLADTSDDFDYRCQDPASWVDTRVTDEAVIGEALAGLDPRSRLVMYLRVGMSEDPMTLDEIGKLEGVTRERIRQIESKAEQRLRSALWTHYQEWEPDRRVFRVASSEVPVVRQAVAEVDDPGRIKKVAGKYGLDVVTLADALRRVREAAD